MRTEVAALAALLAAFAAGCASASPDPAEAQEPARPPASSSLGSMACGGAEPVGRRDLCTFPLDVREFVITRDLCDHFRGEPWPESDAPEDLRRRRELRDGIARTCRGTDRALARLRSRHAADARVIALLSGFEDGVEP